MIMITSCTLFFTAYPETKLETLQMHNCNISLKKQLASHAKPVIATSSTAIGSYLLYDAIRTACVLQDSPQRNTKAAITLNSIIAATLIMTGSYLFKQLWDNKVEEEKK